MNSRVSTIMVNICIDRFREKSTKMWNGKCNLAKEPPPGMVQNNLNIRNGPYNDTSSMRSVSSEDISTSDLPTACCSSNATNPAIKSGRRFQLLQVRDYLFVFCQWKFIKNNRSTVEMIAARRISSFMQKKRITVKMSRNRNLRKKTVVFPHFTEKKWLFYRIALDILCFISTYQWIHD